MPSTAIVWFRRDLRVHDHPALTAARRGGGRRHPAVRVRRAAARRSLAVREPHVVHARERRRPVRVPRRARGRRCGSCPGGPRTSSRHSPASSAPARCTSRATRRRMDAGAIGRSRTGWRRTGSPSARSAACTSTSRTRCARADGGPFTVYSPFRRAWQALDRRPVLPAPDRIPGRRRHGRPLAARPRPGGPAAHRRSRADPRARRGGRPRPAGALARRPDRRLRVVPQPPRPRRDVAAVAGPSLGPAVAQRGRRAGRAARARAAGSSCRSSSGGSSTRTSCGTTRACCREPFQPAFADLAWARRRRRRSARGPRAGPATRSWTRRCASCGRPASCTTGRA